MGRAVSAAEFAEICLALQKRGAENINIVTGSHAVPAIVAGVEEARRQGLAIPLLWNSSGYEGAVSLALLKDTVDVYLPDLKTFDSRVAARFFNAPDYPRVAADAIRKMMEHRALSYGEGRGQGPAAGVLKSGVMVRHLILPGFLDATRDVLRWFAANCRGRALLSVMTQYTPVGGGLTAAAPLGEAAMPSRCVTPEEYETVLGWLDEFGIDDGFCQELITGSEWLPDFSRLNPFSSELSTPAWHWREGFADNGTLCEMYKKDTLKNI
jgi:putative pyruvate formate lyase activating enzyme